MTVQQSLYRKSKNEIKKTWDRVVDLRLNIDTMSLWHSQELVENTLFHDCYRTGSAPYLLLPAILDHIPLRSHDVFYDLGCGMGRVLCLVARKGVSKCVGIEISPILASKAESNARSMKGRISPIEVRVQDVAEADYSDGTMFFLANPFGSDTLLAALTRIEETLLTNPRQVTFIYVNPTHHEVFNSFNWLKYLGEHKVFYSPMVTKYYTNTHLAG